MEPIGPRIYKIFHANIKKRFDSEQVEIERLLPWIEKILTARARQGYRHFDVDKERYSYAYKVLCYLDACVTLNALGIRTGEPRPGLIRLTAMNEFEMRKMRECFGAKKQ